MLPRSLADRLSIRWGEPRTEKLSGDRQRMHPYPRKVCGICARSSAAPHGSGGSPTPAAIGFTPGVRPVAGQDYDRQRRVRVGLGTVHRLAAPQGPTQRNRNGAASADRFQETCVVSIGDRLRPWEPVGSSPSACCSAREDVEQTAAILRDDNRGCDVLQRPARLALRLADDVLRCGASRR